MNEIVKHILDLIKTELGRVSALSENRFFLQGPSYTIIKSIFEDVSFREYCSNNKISLFLVDDAKAKNIEDIGNLDSVKFEIIKSAEIITVRNTRSKNTGFIVFFPPSERASNYIDSNNSTQERLCMDFDVGCVNTNFESWWKDSFISNLVDYALENFFDFQKDSKEFTNAKQLVELVEKSIFDIDEKIVTKNIKYDHLWNTLSRLYESHSTTIIYENNHEKFYASLGLPKSDESLLAESGAKDRVEDIISQISEVFYGDILNVPEIIKVNLSNLFKEEELTTKTQAIEDFHNMLPQDELRMNLVKDNMIFVYGLFQKLILVSPPQWWKELDIETWSKLLESQSKDYTDDSLVLSCTNEISGNMKCPHIVVSDIKLSLSISTEQDLNKTPIDVQIFDGKAQNPLLSISANKKQVSLPSIPVYSSGKAKKYCLRAVSKESKNNKLNIISLADWSPAGVICSDSATKWKQTKSKGRKSESPKYETNLSLPNGEVDIYIFHNADWKTASIEPEYDDNYEEIKSKYIDFKSIDPNKDCFSINTNIIKNLTITQKNGKSKSTHLIDFDVKEEKVSFSNSAFDKLIKENCLYSLREKTSKPEISFDGNTKFANYQKIMIKYAKSDNKDVACLSCTPAIIADDWDKSLNPEFNQENKEKKIFSNKNFNSNPIPSFKEISDDFLSARKDLFNYIFPDNENICLEEIEFSKFDSNLLEEKITYYLRNYLTLLQEDEDYIYIDTVLFFKISNDTIVSEPYAVAVSPLHPIKIAWQFFAQKSLQEAIDAQKPCPGACILDPQKIPALIKLPLNAGSYKGLTIFTSVECSSDYWSLYINNSKINEQNELLKTGLLKKEYGLGIDSFEGSFNESQVRKSMDDVCNMLSVKPEIKVLIAGNNGLNQGTNNGIYNWLEKTYSDENALLSSKSFTFYDTRVSNESRLTETQISTLSDLANQKILWYSASIDEYSNSCIDLGIFSQIELGDKKIIESTENQQPSILSSNGLVSYSIRSAPQENTFRESVSHFAKIDNTESLENTLLKCIELFEDIRKYSSINYSGEDNNLVAKTYVPNIQSVEKLFTNKKAKFVAISSAAITPSVFYTNSFGNNTILWDYELPSYSQKSGDINGYYLLTKDTEVVKKCIKDSVSSLLKIKENQTQIAETIVNEISKRGIPKVKTIAYGNATSKGDLGVTIACRVLQDEFREKQHEDNSLESLLPIIKQKDNESSIVNMIVPIDPFEKKINELTKTLNRAGEKAIKRERPKRPDLLVCSIILKKLNNEKKVSVEKIKFTPIEVKFRSKTFSNDETNQAIEQLSYFNELLNQLSKLADELPIWRITFDHFLLMFLNYGFKIYSHLESYMEKDKHAQQARQSMWEEIESNSAKFIYDTKRNLDISDTGRIIVVENVPQTTTDNNNPNILMISLSDAKDVIQNDNPKLYKLLAKEIKDWNLEAKDDSSSDSTSLPQSKNNEEDIAPDDLDTYTNSQNESSNSFWNGSSNSSENKSSQDESKGSLSDKRILIGKDRYDENVYWEFGNAKLANRHMLISGSSGQGKTYCIQSNLYELSKIGVPSIIFDYTSGFTTDQLEKPFLEEVKSNFKQIIVYKSGVPVNPFKRHEIVVAGEKMLEKSSTVASRISEVFAHVYKFGDQQKAAIHEAVKSGIDKYSDSMNMEKFKAELAILAEQKKSAAASVKSKLVEFFDIEFKEQPDFSWNKILNKDTGDITVFQLVAINRDLQVIITEFLLWDLWNYTVTNGNQYKPFHVVLDEAQNLSHSDNAPAAKILTEGRKFGWSACFATQSLGVLPQDAVKRLKQAAVALYFKPTDEEIPKIAKQLDPNNPKAWISSIYNLTKGHCIFVGNRLNDEGVLRKTLPTLLSVTQFEERCKALS